MSLKTAVEEKETESKMIEEVREISHFAKMSL